MTIFAYFQRAACSTFQTYILNSNQFKAAPCVEVSYLRPLRLGEEKKKKKKKEERNHKAKYYIGRP